MTVIEHIKTGLLWLMIGSSLILSWFVWTYQPAHDELDTPAEAFIEIEDIGESKSLTELLYPSQVISYEDEERFWIHPAGDNYEELLTALEEVELEAMTPVSTDVLAEPGESLQGVEVFFDEALEDNWLPFLFDIEEEDILVENVDRMMILETEGEDTADVVVRFVDEEEEEVFESDTALSPSEMRSFRQGIVTERTLVEPRLFGEDEEDDIVSYTYVAAEPVNERIFMYETNDISEDGFIQSLFPDPDYIEQYSTDGEETSYTDSSRMLHIEDEGSTLHYIHPDSAGGPVTSETMLRTSQEFVNGHFGWTDDYYATSWSDNGDAEAVFTLHVEGLPVFSSNTNNASHYEIALQRAGLDISDYTRPLFQLEEEPFEIDTNIELPAYEEVETQIDEEELFSSGDVEDARIAYSMNLDNSLAVFEPVWFVYARGQWNQITLPEQQEPEVPTDGLE
ncbi:YycH family regulatory protein [Alkalicoccus chagannorensis]|uniref:YycH family regulatory protein n=1 Tax=Alkalicoccus chagannorensis TaxID=427072 RepID=UPI0003F8669C|nr:two-component system activity regulator YycH [Alkalicoccus chagannorensis]